MRRAAAEDGHRPVGRYHRSRMADDALQVGLVHRMENTAAIALLHYPHRRLRRILRRGRLAAGNRKLREVLAVKRFVPWADRHDYVGRIAAAALVEYGLCNRCLDLR